jgi:penicillin-binding protein 1B
MAAYVLYLDHQVRSQFEGKRWALPAHVYARPLELFPNQALSQAQFLAELKLLGYRPVSRPTTAGSYTQLGGAFVLVTRPFQFWDGSEPSRQLRLEFGDGHLLGIWQAQSGDAVDLVRLEPALIGNIYPTHAGSAKNEDRVLVKRSEVPPLLIDALLAVEDREFYSHHGISPRSIVRAMLANLRAGRTVQGGSTLTQQLVKNFFLSNERTLWRKFNEAIMALLLEWHYAKDEILEAYLNEIYLGQDGRRAIHGFGLASQFYFGQSLQQLQPQQIALLVALVKGPSYYDPRRQPLRARQRRDLVLELLARQGKLTPAQLAQASAQPLRVVAQNSTRVSRVPAFIDLVRRQLRRDYSETDLSSEGLRIFTTLDPVTQGKAEQALSLQLDQLQRQGADADLQGASVVVDVDNGEVLAVVGGRDPRFAGFNRALDAVRPVGSLIKPAVYLTALQQPQRYTLASLLDDSPLTVDLGGDNLWQPQNFDHQSHGEQDQVLLYDALAHSYNLATARLGLELGVPAVIETLQGLGIQRPVADYPATLLGAVSFSPLEVAQMYDTLAAGGFRTPLRSIRAVLTAQGQPLQRYPLSVTPAFAGQTVFLVNSALRAVVAEGTGRSVQSRLPPGLVVAGKTGTTDDLRDSWFAGFSDNRLAVVWLGLDDNRPAGLTGARGALRVWGDLMARLPQRSLSTQPPAGIALHWIDRRTGLRVEVNCPHGLSLPFIEGSAPEQVTSCNGEEVFE